MDAICNPGWLEDEPLQADNTTENTRISVRNGISLVVFINFNNAPSGDGIVGTLYGEGQVGQSAI
jgi:hypothetical protein